MTEARAPVLSYAGRLPRRRRVAPLWWRLGVTLACLYLPYGWLLVDDSFSAYRWTWIKIWPILPGLSTFLLIGPHVTALKLFTAMGVMTVLAVTPFVFLAARSRRWFPIP